MWLLLSVVVSGGNREMAPCLVSGSRCAQDVFFRSSVARSVSSFLHVCCVGGGSAVAESFFIFISHTFVFCLLGFFSHLSTFYPQFYFVQLCPSLHFFLSSVTRLSHVSSVKGLVRVCGGVGADVSCCPRGGAVVDLAAEVVLVRLQRLDLLPQLRDLGVQQLLVVRQLDRG